MSISKMKQQLKRQRTMGNVGNKIRASKLGQKIAKNERKVMTFKDPAKRQKAIERLTKQRNKAETRFNKKLDKKGIKTFTPSTMPRKAVRGPVMDPPKGAGIKPTRSPSQVKRQAFKNKLRSPVGRAIRGKRA